MSFNNLLPHTAIIFRRQQGGHGYRRDRFGQPTRDEVPVLRHPCRITNARGKEEFTDRTHDVVVASHELFLKKGADINEQDVVTVLEAPHAVVEAAAVEDPEGYASDFHAVVERAQVLLARRANDARGEHHREVFLSAQRESGEAA